MLLLEITDKGGRPPKLSEEMIWKILAIKSEFSIPTWKQALENAKRIHPTWDMPTYRRSIGSIYKLFEALYWLIQFNLRLNRASFLKKTLE
jgi:hypothetical protein